MDIEAARHLCDEAEERVKPATPGPWVEAETAKTGSYGIRPMDKKNDFLIAVNEGCGRPYTDPQLAADRTFIAHARSDVPQLVSLLREALEENEQLKNALEPWEAAVQHLRNQDELRDYPAPIAEHFDSTGRFQRCVELWPECEQGQ